VKRLIVNADDLGFSEGVNRGIAEAHERGIVTSASLMVDRPGAGDGAGIARRTPGLSVGLHAVLDDHDELTVASEDCHVELARQLARFEELVGRRPTHIDSHHHVHRDERIREPFAAFADGHGLPMRERAVRHCAAYYGEAAIGVDNLFAILGRLGDGDTELGCHPGYAAGLQSRYTSDRESEIRTLTDPRVRGHLDELGIQLIGWSEL
jgi:predicted glycoside hydrolase/deacetylase ChbG (UPF0249 family)